MPSHLEHEAARNVERRLGAHAYRPAKERLAGWLDDLRMLLRSPDALTGYFELLSRSPGIDEDPTWMVREATTTPFGTDDARNLELGYVAAAIGRLAIDIDVTRPPAVDPVIFQAARGGRIGSTRPAHSVALAETVDAAAHTSACESLGWAMLAADPQLDPPLPAMVRAFAETAASHAREGYDRAARINARTTKPHFPSAVLEQHAGTTFTIDRARPPISALCFMWKRGEESGPVAMPYTRGAQAFDGLTAVPSPARADGLSLRDREAFFVAIGTLCTLGLTEYTTGGLVFDTKDLVGLGRAMREALTALDSKAEAVTIDGDRIIDWVTQSETSFGHSTLSGYAIAPLPPLRLRDLSPGSGPELH